MKYIPSTVLYLDSKPKIRKNIFKNEIKKDGDLIQNDNNIIKRICQKFSTIYSCKKIENINYLDIYFYPKFYFNSFEDEKTLSFMVIEEIGSGKTTLLKNFVNFLLDVNMEDGHRYKIILENTNKS